ncbi:hypothetical protein Bca4012_062756 [Brassica carinata]
MQGLRVFSEALDSSFRKSRIANFKTTEVERELFRFRQEAEVARQAESFAAEFQCFKEAQEFVGDFRECRGSVVNLYNRRKSPETMGTYRGFEDTVEVGADENTENGVNARGVNEEVDQPASSFGISASGFLSVDFLL